MLAMLIWIRTRTLVYMVTQPQAAVSKVDMSATAAPQARPVQKRWPVAASIWAALAVSVAMWAAIGWAVLGFMGLFS